MKSSACETVAATGTATVSLPGTCGEWVQGVLDGVPCLDGPDIKQLNF